MAAVVSVVAIFVIHIAAAYPQEAEIIAQGSASGGYENAVSNEARSSVTISSSGAIF